MEFQEWEGIYKEIVKEFGYSIEDDERAAILLSKLLEKKNVVREEEVRRLIEGREVSICGAGENLKDEMKKIEGIIIAADESTSFLMHMGIIPNIIVTDLDGGVREQIKANEGGSIVIIHAHGDNIPLLKKWVPHFNGKVMGTTQSKPFDEIYNFGGFTDGDRAYCLAKYFKAKKIHLIGFNFENPRIKEGKDMIIKKKKLKWAKRIIELF